MHSEESLGASSDLTVTLSPPSLSLALTLVPFLSLVLFLLLLPWLQGGPDGWWERLGEAEKSILLSTVRIYFHCI